MRRRFGRLILGLAMVGCGSSPGPRPDTPPKPKAEARACPPGMLWSEDRCIERASPPTASTGSTAPLCRADDVRGCIEQCGKHDVESCTRVAEQVFAAKIQPDDVEHAQDALIHGCHLGSGLSCLVLGARNDYPGQGRPPNGERAERMYTKACDLGELRGCNNLAVDLETGHAMRQDLPRALALFHRACDGGHALACRNVGRMLRMGIATAPDASASDAAYKRAATLSTEACEKGVAEGCSNLGFMYRSGDEGFPKDEARAREYLKRACDLGYASVCKKIEP